MDPVRPGGLLCPDWMQESEDEHSSGRQRDPDTSPEKMTGSTERDVPMASVTTLNPVRSGGTLCPDWMQVAEEEKKVKGLQDPDVSRRQGNPNPDRDSKDSEEAESKRRRELLRNLLRQVLCGDFNKAELKERIRRSSVSRNKDDDDGDGGDDDDDGDDGDGDGKNDDEDGARDDDDDDAVGDDDDDDDDDDDYHHQAARRRRDDRGPYYYCEDDVEDDDTEIEFHDIVECDDMTIPTYVSRDLVAQLIDSVYYKVFAIVIITCDVTLVALGTNKELPVETQRLISVLDQVVLSLFACEILLKWYHSFSLFWRDGWNILDFAVTSILLLSLKFGVLRDLRTCHILRIVRDFRFVTSVSIVGRLSTVVEAIWESVPAVINIGILLIIFLLMSSVVAVLVFGDHYHAGFGDLQKALFSMFVCITQDGWVTIYKELKDRLASNQLLFTLSALFLIAIIIFGAIVFANLLVAVVATNLSRAVKEADSKGQPQAALLQRKLNKTDDLAFGTTEDIPVIPFSDISKEANLSRQLPLQLTDLGQLDLSILTKYFLVLAALEDNLHEYLSIERDLKDMFEMVRDLNAELKEKESFEGTGQDPG